MKNIRLIFILSLFSSFKLFAQGPEFDKIKTQILEASSERSKIEGIINYGITISRYSSDSIQFYSDSLASTSFTDKAMTNAGQTFFKALTFYNKNELDSAVGYFELAEAQLASLEVPNLWFRCRNFLGINYTRLGEQEQAAAIFLETLEIVKEGNHEKSHARAAHANLINVYRRVFDYASAIYHTERLIEINDDQEMNRATAFAYMNMGQMLSSLKFYERSIEAINLIDFNFLTGSMPVAALKNKAFSFYQLNQYDSAIANYKRALEFKGRDVNPDLELSSRVFLADIYTKIDSFQLAEQSFEKAESLINSRTQEAAIVQLTSTKIDYLIKVNQLDEAIQIGLELESNLNKKSMMNMSQDVLLKKSNLYQLKGNEKLALKYSQLYNDLNIARRNSSYDQKIEQARLKLTKMESQREIEQAEESALFYQQINSQQLALTFISLVALAFIYRFYRKEKSEKGLKEEEIKELNKQLNELISNQNKAELDSKFLTLKSHAVVALEDIIFIQSDGPYLEFYLTNKERPEIDRNTLKKVLGELPKTNFIQVHRSYIVNLSFIQSIYSNKLVLKNGKELIISRSFKTQVESALKLSA